MLEAVEACGIWKGGISTVLKGKQKTAGGYVWKYKEVNNNEKSNCKA
ncbi:MAG: hypothetical protein K2H85_06420 [Allobaculum sp.]|nr:hypothetical protein [Allobaculum sp.]